MLLFLICVLYLNSRGELECHCETQAAPKAEQVVIVPVDSVSDAAPSVSAGGFERPRRSE